MLSEENIEELRKMLHIAITVDDFRAIEAAVLAEQAKQEPLMWSFTGSTRLMDEHEARLEAKRCGGATKAFPLYRTPVVQPDMVMVPREPTEEMIDAAMNRYQHGSESAARLFMEMHRENFRCDYRAMIAAATKAE